MSSINYITGIVRILELPYQEFLLNEIMVTTFRGQIYQLNGTQILNLTFWGDLANDVALYYNIDDFIIVEGYLSLDSNELLNSDEFIYLTHNLVGLRIYPYCSEITDPDTVIFETFEY